MQSAESHYIKAFKDGAEFGYNKCKEELNQNGLALQSDMDKTIEQNIALKKELEKANEWHYDEPTESKNNFYVILKNGNHIICYWDLTSKAYKWLKNVVNGEHITFNLIRCWKEIVLPEPKESE